MSSINAEVCQFELKPKDYPMKSNRCAWWHIIPVQGHRRKITLVLPSDRLNYWLHLQIKCCWFFFFLGFFFVCFVSKIEFEVYKELVGLAPVQGQTKGFDFHQSAEAFTSSVFGFVKTCWSFKLSSIFNSWST